MKINILVNFLSSSGIGMERVNENLIKSLILFHIQRIYFTTTSYRYGISLILLNYVKENMSQRSLPEKNIRLWRATCNNLEGSKQNSNGKTFLYLGEEFIKFVFEFIKYLACWNEKCNHSVVQTMVFSWEL